jgi:hypothetical protein
MEAKGHTSRCSVTRQRPHPRDQPPTLGQTKAERGARNLDTRATSQGRARRAICLVENRNKVRFFYGPALLPTSTRSSR